MTSEALDGQISHCMSSYAIITITVNITINIVGHEAVRLAICGS